MTWRLIALLGAGMVAVGGASAGRSAARSWSGVCAESPGPSFANARRAPMGDEFDSVGSLAMGSRHLTPAAGIRPRTDGDLDQCVRLLGVVHEVDRYPTHWPHEPARWLSPRGLLGAWVAVRHGRIVGHVALRAGTAVTDASAWSRATGLSPEQLAAITRLFVAPDTRRSGVGSGLLDAACTEAVARSLQPVIDVVDTDRAAIRFYEQRGWRRAFSEAWAGAEDDEALLHYYVAPSNQTA